MFLLITIFSSQLLLLLFILILFINFWLHEHDEVIIDGKICLDVTFVVVVAIDGVDNVIEEADRVDVVGSVDGMLSDSNVMVEMDVAAVAVAAKTFVDAITAASGDGIAVDSWALSVTTIAGDVCSSPAPISLQGRDTTTKYLVRPARNDSNFTAWKYTLKIGDILKRENEDILV